jgi:hypothetical protein
MSAITSKYGAITNTPLRDAFGESQNNLAGRLGSFD